ncbi:MAG: hypothetical protein B7C55_05340 [Actinomycetales bacterium mxb001]|nr:MAG: hypothetical protein B7C55_05340 [Actinomycetales bacterium mxb001]
MQHPLRQARPDDPFLRYHLDESQVVDFLVDEDHVGFIRAGRRSGELWVSALGDDPGRILEIIDFLSARRQVDGIHVHDHVYALLPERLRIPDPGHWSIWLITAPDVAHDLSDWARGAREIDAHDARIDPLLSHSDSAYLMAGDPSIRRWVGVLDGPRLVAVGAESDIADGIPHLVSICTDPEQRRHGHGKAVTAQLVSGAFERGESLVYLEMYAGNKAAASLYRSLGFREVGRYRSGWIPGRAPRPAREPA